MQLRVNGAVDSHNLVLWSVLSVRIEYLMETQARDYPLQKINPPFQIMSLHECTNYFD